MKTRVTDIADRYEMSMIVFHRDNNPGGRIYIPTDPSKRRFATVVTRMFKAGDIECFSRESAPRIYRYNVKPTTEDESGAADG